MPKVKRGHVRIQLEATPKFAELLSKLKLSEEAASYAEVIRKAAKVLDSLRKIEKEDGSVTLVRNDGRLVKIFI